MLIAGVSADASANFVTAPSDSAATQLGELEVTGRRVSDNLKTTAPVHNLDAAKLLTTGVTDISDALRRLPGVTLRDYGGSGGMKTVSVRGLGAQHTNVAYDGIVLSDVQGGQIDLSRYSLHNMNCLSLVIGDDDNISQPARALSASSTLSVMTMQNPDMMERGPQLDVKFRAGSFTTLNPYLHFAASNGDNLGMTLTGEFTHAKNNYPFRLVNGDHTSIERRNNSQFDSGHAEWNGVWKPTAASRLHAKSYFYASDRNLPGPVIYYNNVSNQRLDDLNTFGQLSYSTRLGRIFTLKAFAKYNYSDTHYTDKDGKYPGGQLDERYKQQEEYISANLTCRPLEGLSAAYAADYWHNSMHSNLRGENRPTRNSMLHSLSLKWQVWRLTATAHGLYSWIRDKATDLPDGKVEQQLSPSVGVSLQPLKNTGWWIRASYKNIFRMPTFNELYFDHYGSVNLKPEKADQLNLGMTYELTDRSFLDRFAVTVDAYHNTVRNKIVAMPYNMFVMTMTNLGKVRILGTDISMSLLFRLAKGHTLDVEGNYSYQRAAIRTDKSMADWNKQVAYTPLHSGSWSVTWKNPWVNLALHGTGCSERYSTNLNIASTRIKGYMDCGVTLFREFRYRRNTFSVRADMANALNTQYEIIARYPMPGRSLSLTVGYSFK